MNIPRTQDRHLLLTAHEWQLAIASSLALSAIAAIYTAAISLWIPLSIFLTTLTFFQLLIGGRIAIGFPQIAFLISALQYVLAAWASLYVPSLINVADMRANLAGYLQYAGPVLAIGWIAWLASTLGLRSRQSAPPPFTPELSLQLDIVMGIALVAVPFARFVGVGEVAFLFALVGNLRYLAVFARMICRGRGWKWRLGLVLAFEVLFAADSTMFHPLLLWVMWTFAVWIYAGRPRPRVVLSTILIAIILPPVQRASEVVTCAIVTLYAIAAAPLPCFISGPLNAGAADSDRLKAGRTA